MTSRPGYLRIPAVKLTDFIPKKAILHSLKAKDKRDAILELVQAAKKGAEGEKFVVADIAEAVFAREKMGTTGVGGGVGIPHAKLDGVKGLIGAFGRSEGGIDFNAVDRDRVHLEHDAGHCDYSTRPSARSELAGFPAHD